MQRLQAALVFFFGTPRRALYSVVGLLVLIAICYPPAVMWLIGRVLLAVSPLVTLIVIVAIFFGVGRVMFGGIKLPKPKEEKK
jgi:hypothetical protein